jgi:hypothetical protein
MSRQKLPGSERVNYVPVKLKHIIAANTYFKIPERPEEPYRELSISEYIDILQMNIATLKTELKRLNER